MRCSVELGLERRAKRTIQILDLLDSGGSLIISYRKRIFQYATLGRGGRSRPNG